MGNEKSTRWSNHAKKTTVDKCRRISAREAKHIGIATTTTPVAISAARRLWALCPECGARVWYLYQAPNTEQWKCRQCHGLAYKSAQQRGTWAAFYEWLDQDDRKNWREYTETHPSHDWLYTEAGKEWDRLCAPYDTRKMGLAEHFALREKLGSEAAIQRVFERNRSEWSGILHNLETRAAQWAMDDLKAEWKKKHRSKGRNQL
jgi:hypothetical protein